MRKETPPKKYQEKNNSRLIRPLQNPYQIPHSRTRYITTFAKLVHQILQTLTFCFESNSLLLLRSQCLLKMLDELFVDESFLFEILDEDFLVLEGLGYGLLGGGIEGVEGEGGGGGGVGLGLGGICVGLRVLGSLEGRLLLPLLMMMLLLGGHCGRQWSGVCV